MDTLAAVLGKTRRTKELDQLASRLMSIRLDHRDMIHIQGDGGLAIIVRA